VLPESRVFPDFQATGNRPGNACLSSSVVGLLYRD
jgi:hypothetical protein